MSRDSVGRALRDAAREVDPSRQAARYFEALTLAREQRRDLLAPLLARFDAPGPSGSPMAARLPAGQRFEVRATGLELALRRDDSAEVDRLAPLLAPANRRQAAVAARLLAQVHARRGEHFGAARLLLDLLTAPGHLDADAITQALWRQLSKLPPTTLDRWALAAGTPAANAWRELAREVRHALTPSAQAWAWQRWRRENPHHAAALHPPAELLRPVPEPGAIALLLPLSGQLAALGATIRDGFMAAYLHSRQARQTVVLYDTGALGAAAAYRRAEAEGADVVVGPLDKAAVSAVFAARPRRPVVALNNPTTPPHSTPTPGTSTSAPAPPNAVRLALAVEDEAAAIGAAMARDHVTRVLAFVDATDWAVRAVAALRADANLRIVATETLGTVDEYTDLAAKALGIAESEARHAELQRQLGTPLAFTPRRRGDLDAIVAFARPEQLLALKPALDFHFAADLPLYVWSGAPRGESAARLKGARVCDIPWRLHPAPLRRKAAAFPSERADSALFALGVDGYRIANQLPRLLAEERTIAGSTGVLTLTAGGRVRRQLACAVVGERRADG